MKKLDQYFYKELFKVFLISVFISELVLLGLQGIRLSSLIVNQGLEWRILGRLILGLTTSFLPAVIPISFLFSLLIVFGRMAYDRELVALQAMGFGVGRMLRPGLKLGGLVALLSLLMAFVVGPFGNRNFEIAIDTIYRKKATSVLRSGTIAEGFLGMVVFVDEVDSFSQRLNRVFMYDESSFNENTSISASWGQWVYSNSGKGVLNLYDGIILTQNHESDRIQRVRFDEYSLNVDFSVDLAGSRNSPASQGWQELVEERRSQMSAEVGDPRRAWSEIVRRFAISLACFLFVPLAFLLALDNSRSAKNRAVFTGIVVVVGYYGLYFLMSTLYSRWSWAPLKEFEALAWIIVGAPNLVLLAVDSWLYRKKIKIQH